MAFRSSRLRAALLLLPLALAPVKAPAQGQAAAPAPAALPPPEVDQALRERATQFLQNQVDGSFRKSIELVAEDTKDWYFAAGKAKVLSFKIESIEYSENFTKATVTSASRRTVSAAGQTFTIDLPMRDLWKIEDGKWFWYQDSTIMSTPIGSIPAPTPGAAAPGETKPSGLPTDMSPEAVAEAGRRLTGGTSSVDKKAIAFSEGNAAVEEIVFHNGAPGIVKLLVNKILPMDSISVDVTEVTVNADQDLRVKVSYTPDGSRVKRTIIRFMVEPFGKVYSVPVTLTAKRP